MSVEYGGKIFATLSQQLNIHTELPDKLHKAKELIKTNQISKED